MTSAAKSIKTIHEILGQSPVAEPENPVSGVPPLGDLPVMVEPEKPAPVPPPVSIDLTIPASRMRGIFSKSLVRYALVFIFAFAFFYVALNFKAVSSQISGFFSPPPKQDKVVLASDLDEYNTWMKKYYVYESDPGKLAADADPDQDGLTNLDEFTVGANPFNPDTNSNGYADGQDVVDGYNPLYFGKLTAGQQNIVKDKLDTVAIAKRINFQVARGVAGANTLNPSQSQLQSAADFVVNVTQKGLVEIPRLNLSIPLIWTTDFSKVQEDLEYGVVHHPDTVLPGQPGLSSIHGHSSGYPWDGGYKTAFTKLNLMEAGDEAFVTVYDASGDSRRYRYVVKSKKVYEKDDPMQFQPPGVGSFLNLSTSWPVGTAQKRYVVTTELAGL